MGIDTYANMNGSLVQEWPDGWIDEWMHAAKCSAKQSLINAFLFFPRDGAGCIPAEAILYSLMHPSM
jgi:hypothetical protein